MERGRDMSDYKMNYNMYKLSKQDFLRVVERWDESAKAAVDTIAPEYIKILASHDKVFAQKVANWASVAADMREYIKSRTEK